MLRTGFGYDSHRFAPDRPLLLGGIEIPNDFGLAGHSDADAVLHAITDALLGAIGESDIGDHFPDNDPRFKNADSRIFVNRAMELLQEQGFAVVNCDVTILAEKPKLGPKKAEIKANLARLLEVEPNCIAVKAKTNEQMGAIGRGEGIAAMASVLIQRA